MAVEERILIQLALRGIDPAQLEQMARMTGDQLEAKMREVYDKLNALHRKKAAEQDTEEKKKIASQIAELEKYGKAATRVINSQQTNWRRLLEDMENVTVVLQGAFGAIGAIGGAVTGAWGKFKEWGEEVVKVTNIHRAFKGNLDELKEATGGEIAGIDLMIAHNRALAGGLELTDAQFKAVANSADDFADAVGESTEEGLNKLIQALTTGSEKSLKLLGIVVDNTEANKKYAESHALVIDKMTEEQKLQAFREEAIRKLGERAENAYPKVSSFADALERLFATIKGSGGVLAAIGGMGAGDQFDDEILRLKLAAKASPQMDLQSEIAKVEARRAAAYGKASSAEWESKKAGMSEFQYPEDGYSGGDGQLLPPGISAKTQEALTAEARRRRAASAASAASRKRSLDTAFDPLLQSMYASQARGRGQSSEEDFLDLLAGAGGDKSLEDLTASLTEATLPTIEDRIAQMEENLVSDTVRAAGGGVLAQLLYGKSGAEYAQTEMEIWQQGLQGVLNDVQMAQGAIAQAAGDGVFNLIAGNQNKAFRQIAKDTLDTLGKMAMAKAIWYGLEAAGYGIVGLAPQAIAAAKLAGAYGVAASTFGIGSRALTSDPSPGSAAATPRAVSSLGSGGSAGGSGGPAGGPGVTVVVNGALPGSEAEIGRQISKAVEAYQRQYGRRPN